MGITAKERTILESPGLQNEEQASILKVLAYFDIFQYPLSYKEIRQFLGTFSLEAGLDKILHRMLASQTVFFHNGFYSLHDNPLLSHKRIEGNRRAEKLLPKAYKIGRFLFRFPFVRAIGISGSLSKNFADENADIDFFIITKANRLWIARTIMHLFKKLTFITGHQHFFCMNYYIDEEALLVEEQNVFTAIEVTTLVPVCGKKTFDDFFAVNNWSCQFFATAEKKYFQNEIPVRSFIKSCIEWILNNCSADHLEKWLLKITTQRWQKKSLKDKRNKNGLRMKLVTGKHFARSNPGAFQEKVLALYEQKLAGLKL